MKKKLILLPITLTALTPMISIVGCGGEEPVIGEWIEWDYKDGEYVNDKYMPLTDCPDDPISAGFDKIAQNPNNIIYDCLLQCNAFVDDPSLVEMKKCSMSIKIDSYDPMTHAFDYEINKNFDLVNEGKSANTEIIQTISLKCHHIILDVYKDADDSCYWRGTPTKYNYSSQGTYEFLTSDLAGDWSITGSYYSEAKTSDFTQIYQDLNCEYNKESIKKIYGKDPEKWYCLWHSYDAISERMYYLQNCH